MDMNEYKKTRDALVAEALRKPKARLRVKPVKASDDLPKNKLATSQPKPKAKPKAQPKAGGEEADQ